MDVDGIQIVVYAGNGGKGADSYYRRTDRKVVAHGGDGGNGGSVIFRADPKAPLLKTLKYKRKLVAEHGANGGSSSKRGRNGEDLLVLVPCGCKIYDREKSFLIRELLHSGDEVIVAQGGKGGSGNQGGKQATAGELGVILDLEITLCIPADIFLVGLPNSGKSKFLSRMTNAKLSSEDYPFSTTMPHLGIFQISDYEQIALCELPSLYAHSHEGRGVGTDFLKHLEVAKWVAYFLEVDSRFAKSLKEGYDILRDQIERVQPDYLKIPSFVVVNKKDLVKDGFSKLKRGFRPGIPVFYLSALTGDGTQDLIDFLSEQMANKS